MARLDPNVFPDRFALDRYARRMRREEADRMLRAVAQWLRGTHPGRASAPVAPARSAPAP